LPIGYLARQDDLLARMRFYGRAFNPYRELFITGTRAYQQYTYFELVQRVYGRAVARQVEAHQRHLFDFMTGDGRRLEQSIDLVQKALTTRTVSAITPLGEVEIPIEMNVALALLLGLPESPDYVATTVQRVDQITRMQPEIDWCLANELACARAAVLKKFSSALAHLDDIAVNRRGSATPDHWSIPGDG
jgi:hypothetical protein